ncbi:NAD(P)/FAD-dependent oxidoreductase [Kushneria aurantia]|uniref:NAD(P)/FAD-dependent oxidoreductase n=1 Tax=Kushneria aurantia TaxID=504092 RepID=A0ABV6G4Y7_9GAMM|nr:FAD-binding oxidoreductase [Kushneria aurantia]
MQTSCNWWRADQQTCSELTPLQENIKTDTLIIGAGLTGLSCAYHLALERHIPVVIDAGDIGWGASGRSGGQIIPGLKACPREIEALLPTALAERMNQLTGQAADYTFSLIKSLDIKCQARQAGWIQGAHCRNSLKQAYSRAEQWRERGADVTLLDAEGIRKELGGGNYTGGWIDHRGGNVQPYLYTLGLASACLRAGVQIHINSRAVEIKRSGGIWQVACNNQHIVCKNIVLATNGYSDDSLDDLRRSIIPMVSLQGATAPLSIEDRSEIIPNRRSVSETRRLLNYYHVDAENRLLFGSASSFRDRPNRRDRIRLKKEMVRIFPNLGQYNFDYLWNGRVAVTRQHLPMLHRVRRGLYTGYGFNGRGMALSTLMGDQLARLVMGAEESELSLPLTLPRPYTGHALHRPVAEALLLLYRLKDRVEERFA